MGGVVSEMFVPEKIYYEDAVFNYELGKQLLNKYKNVEQYS